jgi:hypothetical protein
LRALPIQYADFSAWQHQWLQGEALDQQLNYWKQQLGGELPLLRLPTDRPYPAVQTTNGNWHLFSLPADLTEQLKTLSRRQGVTLFMTLLAAFQTLLRRYTNQDDVITGSVIANRNRKETEGLIGFFLNTLALRTDFSGDPSFRDLLERVRETTLGAYAHQDVPFEKLVEVLQPDRNLSHPPFFQVMFSLQNAPMEELQLPGLVLKPVPVHKGTAGFDLELSLTEKKNGLEGWLEYNTDLFDATTVQRIAGHLEVLLHGIVENPNQRVSEFAILTQEERSHLLEMASFVLDDTRSLLPIGVDGELYVSDAGSDGETTATEFIPNPFSTEPGARLYKTGQWACCLPDGTIKLKGRREHLFKVRGCLVSPREIEDVLLEYPSINETVVVASDDDGLIAHIVFAGDQESSADDVRDFLQKRLPQYLVPTLCVLDVLPRTSTGDIDRQALPQLVAASAGINADFEGPRTPTEHVVSGIWQEVLGVPRIGIHDKFFELGGDSLKLLRTYLLLNELYPDALTVADLFKHSTIEFVSSHLDSAFMNVSNQAAPAIQSFEL